MESRLNGWMQDLSAIMSIFGVINLILYLGQHLLGLPIEIRYGVGAVIFSVGGVILGGDGLKHDYMTRSLAKAEDMRRFRQTRLEQESFAWLLVILGLATVGFTVFFP